MDKYECRFFQNGRVVFVLEEDINAAINARKELLVICNSWSGGYAIAIGANEIPDCESPSGIAWEMYSYEVRDKEFTSEELQKFYKVIITSGEKIMMKTRDQATSYWGGVFIDYDTKKPGDMSDKQWEVIKRTVDAQTTINMINDDEKVKCLSHYYNNIDWTGTKFERKEK